MKLIAFTLPGIRPEIRAASSTREWMDATPNSYAYRCLPLNIANTHGWEILCSADFRAVWDGGIDQKSIRVTCAQTPDPEDMPTTHFGSGILTFPVNALFRTEEGYNLFISGPANAPKDGIAPLQGIVETDWSPYTFTMNWKFTRPGTIEFKKGEPFCSVFPVLRSAIEAAEPEFRPMGRDSKTLKYFAEWMVSRFNFLANLKIPGSAAVQEKWQKRYYRGVLPDQQPGCPAHQVKLHVKEFKGL